jgi:uncharacterized protein (DUF58 family)
MRHLSIDYPGFTLGGFQRSSARTGDWMCQRTRRLRANRNVILSIIRSRNVKVCSKTAETCAAIAAISAYATTE